MAKINLAALSLKELVELQKDLPGVIADRARAERADVRAKLAAIASDAGFSLDEILNTTKGSRRGSKSGSAPVKYRNPENPDETWSGRGRMATWLKEKIAKRGVKLEDFAV